jgi:adenosine deaminase
MTSIVRPSRPSPARLAFRALLSIPIMLSVVALNGCGPTTGPTEGEQRAAQAFDLAKSDRADALGLEAFLVKMPKGADLHMHLSGAVYAETFLKEAIADGRCADPRTLTLVKSPGAPTGAPKGALCAAGSVPVANALKDQRLYDSLVDAFSMRSFVATPGVSGHDQFFATFDRFGALGSLHAGEWLDEVATRATSQNEQYLEIMQTPSFFELAPLWNSLGWPATPAGARIDPEGDTTGTSPSELSALRAKLLAGGLQKEVALDVQELDEALAARNAIEHCGQADGTPACSVKIRYLYQVLRAFPPQQVFAQTVLAFEVASADPNVVGLNFVQPEDAYMAMSEYNRQMHMLDYLHSIYPRVHISLHAGELAPGMVPPNGLRFHIREAVELGHAERIGHGVDVMYETDPRALLHEMAARHIMVEINLTSNEVILGIEGDEHPLADYMTAHVPVALSTDDEGVSRIDLTHEYVRAVLDQGLGYLELKKMARASIEHSFLPGKSLWQKPDTFVKVDSACAGKALGALSPGDDCGNLLKSSEKAAQEWELEHRFAVFEANPRK